MPARTSRDIAILSMTTFLANAFRSVDSADTEKLGNCLERIDSLAAFRPYKEASYRALDLQPNSKIADAACGLGFDLIRLAERVPEGEVTGFDISQEFIDRAIRRTEGCDRIVVRRGDLRELDCPDAFFDGVRVDRSLQHIDDLDAAISEIVRITKEGGKIVAAEPDWSSFRISSSDTKISSLIEEEFSSNIRNPELGIQLADRLGAHLEICENTVHAVLLRSRDEVEIVYDLTHTVERSTSKGLLDKEAAEAFLKDLLNRAAQGTFHALLCIHVVSGMK